jgi:hypothetical protein
MQGGNSGMKDLTYVNSGQPLSSGRRAFNMRSTLGNSWAADIDTTADPSISAAIHDDSPSALLMNVRSRDFINGGVWMAADLLTMLGCEITHRGGERPLRGYGSHILLHDVAANATIKTACTFAGDSALMEFCYIRGGSYTHETNEDGGDAINIGHTSSAGGPGVRWVVIEQAYVDGNLVVRPESQFPVSDVVCRNNIVVDQIEFNSASNAYGYHNTSPTSRSNHVRLRSSGTDFEFAGNLMAAYTLIGFDRECVNMDTGLTRFANNIFPVQPNPDEAIRIGSPRYSIATIEATYAWASGNGAASVSLDGNFRPANPSDPNILVPAEADMAAFAEDYYGNPRFGSSWTAGAVGEI